MKTKDQRSLSEYLADYIEAEIKSSKISLTTLIKDDLEYWIFEGISAYESTKDCTIEIL